MEKSLFQIAIERILDRFQKATPDDQEEVFLTLHEATKRPEELHSVSKPEAVAKLLKILFPELRQEAR